MLRGSFPAVRSWWLGAWWSNGWGWTPTVLSGGLGITMTYLGFVLGAMGTDFFPRLSAPSMTAVRPTGW